MAKNRVPEKAVEAKSANEDESSSRGTVESESGDEEASEEEQIKSPLTKKPTSQQKKPQPVKPSSSSSDEETESESDAEEPENSVKPLASKPMNSPIKTAPGKNMKSKPAPATPVNSTGSKRPMELKEADKGKGNKKSKKNLLSAVPQSPATKVVGSTEDLRKAFQRVWSEKDEIEMLKGMIEYKEKKRCDPAGDLNAFHEFIKKNLDVDVSRSQLQDKIRRLKKKYENNKSKEIDGKERVFSKPHEQESYDLSSRIWGKENVNETVAVKADGRHKENETLVSSKTLKIVNVNAEEMNMLVPKRVVLNKDGESTREWIERFGSEMFEKGKNAEGKREWRKLKLEEINVYMKKLELLRSQAKLVLDELADQTL